MNLVEFLKLKNKKKGSKYKNDSCWCAQGHIHDSRAEARYCNILQLRKKAGDIKSFRNQVTFPLIVNGKTVTSHRVDFLVTGNDGKDYVDEFKGPETDAWKIKRKLFIALHPDIPYNTIKKANRSTAKKRPWPTRKLPSRPFPKCPKRRVKTKSRPL